MGELIEYYIKFEGDEEEQSSFRELIAEEGGNIIGSEKTKDKVNKHIMEYTVWHKGDEQSRYSFQETIIDYGAWINDGREI